MLLKVHHFVLVSRRARDADRDELADSVVQVYNLVRYDQRHHEDANPHPMHLKHATELFEPIHGFPAVHDWGQL